MTVKAGSQAQHRGVGHLPRLRIGLRQHHDHDADRRVLDRVRRDDRARADHRGGARRRGDLHRRRPGLALVLDVLDANIFEVIKINASGKLQLNTTSVARTLAGITMNGDSFLIALSGEVKFLEVLKFSASFVLEVGYEGVGSWRVEFRAGMDFFGLVTLQASGMFNYKGYFDISLDGELVLGTRSFGLVANFHFRVAFGERPVVGDARAHRVLLPGRILRRREAARLRHHVRRRQHLCQRDGLRRGPGAAGGQASAEVEFLFFSVSRVDELHARLRRTAEEGLPRRQSDRRRAPVESGGRQRGARPQHGRPQRHPRHRRGRGQRALSSSSTSVRTPAARRCAWSSAAARPSSRA